MIIKNKKIFNKIENDLIILNERLKTTKNFLDYKTDSSNLEIKIGNLKLESVEDIYSFIKKKNIEINKYWEKIAEEERQRREEIERKKDKAFWGAEIDFIRLIDMEEILDNEENEIGVNFTFGYGDIRKKIDCYFTDYVDLRDYWDNWCESKFNIEIINLAKEILFLKRVDNKK